MKPEKLKILEDKLIKVETLIYYLQQDLRFRGDVSPSGANEYLIKVNELERKKILAQISCN